MSQPINWMKTLMAMFSCEGRPVTSSEFSVFWKSCTDEQKAYYKAQVGA